MAGTISDELFGQGKAMGGKRSMLPEGDTVALEVPAPLALALKQEARRAHKSAAELVASIVAEYLEDLEDARVVARRRSGKTVPASEVFARNALEG